MNNYFCGWYFKCQSKDGVIAFIPAFHIENGERTCSLQVITEDGAWNLTFSGDSMRKKKGELYVELGENIFCERGLKVDLHTDHLQVSGKLRFGKRKPLKYDIMGPFSCVPFMECRHSVYSMEHTVNGQLCVNGRVLNFEKGLGYLEGDRGSSFPSAYAWSQCHFGEGSLMLSAAEIPLGKIRFTGIICVILWKGKEYRLATYLGARAEKLSEGEICIRQGSSVLHARLLQKGGTSLYAPSNGVMSRIIRESPSCRAAYSFQKDGRTLFSFETSRAAFEYEYPRQPSL